MPGQFVAYNIKLQDRGFDNRIFQGPVTDSGENEIQGMTKFIFQTGGRVFFLYMNQNREDMAMKAELKFKIMENLKRIEYSESGKLSVSMELNHGLKVKNQGKGAFIFVIDGARNGQCDFDFDANHLAFEMLADEVLSGVIKHDPQLVSQRKVNNAEIDVFVYEWVGKTESAVWIENMTVHPYTERQTFKVTNNNLIFPFPNNANTNTMTIPGGESRMIRMARKDFSQPGDFIMQYEYVN